MNILLTIQYDGKDFFGWQIQNSKRTVQGDIEEALYHLFKEKICIRGASRTDTGVHANCQLAVFKYDCKIPMNKLPFAINSFLKRDVVITNATTVSDDFHPQYSVYKKTYRYKIYNSNFNNPLFRNYAEFVHKPLDIIKMNEACKYFIGKYDFKAFCSTGSTSKTTIREIYEIFVKKDEENIFTIEVTGNGFLYNMVRIIAGTLIEIGIGKYPPEYVEEIISSKNRKKAGRTASSKGLTLYKIYYN